MPAAPDARLHELGIELPKQLPVIGSYRFAKRHRGIVDIAGRHDSLRLDHSDLIRGKSEDDRLEQAHEADRIGALHTLCTLWVEIGSLDRVASTIKVVGMVNVGNGFVQLAVVLDGATNDLSEVFGPDAGRPRTGRCGQGRTAARSGGRHGNDRRARSTTPGRVRNRICTSEPLPRCGATRSSRWAPRH